MAGACCLGCDTAKPFVGVIAWTDVTSGEAAARVEKKRDAGEAADNNALRLSEENA